MSLRLRPLTLAIFVFGWMVVLAAGLGLLWLTVATGSAPHK